MSTEITQSPTQGGAWDDPGGEVAPNPNPCCYQASWRGALHAHPFKSLFLIIKLSYETEQTLHFSSGLLCQRWHSCVPGITVDRHDAWPSFVEEDDMWLPNQFSNFIHRDSRMLSSWPLAIFCFCSAVGNRIVILKWPSLQYSEQRYL